MSLPRGWNVVEHVGKTDCLHTHKDEEGRDLAERRMNKAVDTHDAILRSATERNDSSETSLSGILILPSLHVVEWSSGINQHSLNRSPFV